MAELPTVGRFVGGAGYAPLTEARLRDLVGGIPACRELLKGDAADRGRRHSDAMNVALQRTI
jgi:hypothetical protein